MKNLISKTLYTIGIALLFFTVQPAFSQQFSEIIAFGDSLTDVGNVAELTVPGVSPVINGYYHENHFSDNIIWVETLANYLGLPARTLGRGNSTTLPPLPDGNTWAWGGSEASIGLVQVPGVIEPIPNLLKQVTQYLEANVPNESTLYTIWSGANNLLIGGQYGPEGAQQAVKAIRIAIQRLEAAGARQILVFNLPKLGETPSAEAGGPLVQLTADIYSDAFNKALSKTVKKLRNSQHFHAELYLVDIFSEFLKIINTVNHGRTYTPKFFVPGPPVAINNVTSEGLIFFQTFGTFPTDYLFWDGVHPTTQGHQLVAGLVLKTLEKSQQSASSSSSSRDSSNEEMSLREYITH